MSTSLTFNGNVLAACRNYAFGRFKFDRMVDELTERVEYCCYSHCYLLSFLRKKYRIFHIHSLGDSTIFVHGIELRKCAAVAFNVIQGER